MGASAVPARLPSRCDREPDGGIDHHRAVEVPGLRHLERVLRALPQGRQYQDLPESGGLREGPGRRLGAGLLDPVLQLPGVAGADLDLMPEAGETSPERLAYVA